MTQPDLVSKLRELKAKGKVGWMDSTDFADELGHAFGGNKVYPDAEDCRRAHPCIDSAAETYPCSAQRVIVFDADELESLLGLEGQAAEKCLCNGENDSAYCPVHGAHVDFDKPIIGSDGAVQTGWKSCGPSQPETDGGTGRQPELLLSPSVQASPSTPIVPGTAGLSAYAEFDKAVKYLQVNGYGDWDGTANGQEITLTGCANMMRQYRKDALRAAEQVVKRWNYMACSDVDGLVAEIRALAERPAPAGEVSKGERQ